MDPAAGWLADRLGVGFSDPRLFELALTHRSHGAANNERLEYLGDAVLSFAVAELLFRRFPAASEGELSRYRASLVSGDSLAAIAADLGLGEHLRLGEGELKSGGQRRATILADGLEAVFGALYLDQGLDVARAVAEVDATLEGAARSTAARMQDDLKKLHAKIIQAAKRKDETLRRQFKHAQAQAFPGGHPQEREIGFVYFLNKYGPGLVDRLREELPPATGTHWVITI